MFKSCCIFLVYLELLYVIPICFTLREDLAVRRKGGVRRKLISSNKVNVSRLENKAQTVVPVTTMSGKSPEEKPVINENVTTNIRKDVGSTNIPGTNGDGKSIMQRNMLLEDKIFD